MAKVFGYPEAVYPNRINCGHIGWSMFVEAEAASLSDTAALHKNITVMTGTYAQFSGQSRVEVVSTTGSTGIVRVVGVDDKGRKAVEDITLSGTSGTATTGDIIFRYLENIFLSTTGTSGIITAQTTGGTYCMSISSGQVAGAGAWSSLMHRYTGHLTTYLTMMHASFQDSITDNVWFDLRWYQDDADTTNYITLARLFCAGLVAVSGGAPGGDLVAQPAPLYFTQPLRIPAGSYIAVFADAATASSDGASCLLQGFDVDEGGAGGTVA